MAVNQSTNYSRLGLFGDIPTRMMNYVIRTFPGMPAWLEASLLYFFSFIVFALARQQREAIRANLKTIHADLAFCEAYVGAYLVFVNFGWSFIDSLRVRNGQDVITWDVQGEEILQDIRDKQEAAILFTTHTGNYDLAASLFASQFKRVLHTVRMPERSPELQEIREKELAEDAAQNSHFRVHYNKEDKLLGIELAQLLSDGELLAIQCDRVVGQVVEIAVPLERADSSFRIPKGPMTLACFSRCPCYPLYVIRERRRHYRVIFEPALQVPLTTAEGKRAKPREMDYAQAWVKQLMRFLDQYSYQWFVFEHAFNPKETP
ncbi:hypothetical protein JIN77_11790 [Verrucomicrobiaceae bacterium R5-34]|uniref:Lipid A biosynthesis acyltransferase n=1 Tax=Oceaniferula flava TaxID=2800421 RepID=A0AAE2SBP6_9BACT|nr:hypothetical protein [Oceaniferula flavus]MBK1831412.1 hypothetical protein [Verrucomicrobiaceae bacterium R5-34]MBK1854918.1 hypothetical protein [Oceaniferula flavus]MBM1136224.1 hypothetical protein [Oceaniferula flavus]